MLGAIRPTKRMFVRSSRNRSWTKRARRPLVLGEIDEQRKDLRVRGSPAPRARGGCTPNRPGPDRPSGRSEPAPPGPSRADPGHLGVELGEKLGRGDVVVDDRLFARADAAQAPRSAARAGRNGGWSTSSRRRAGNSLKEPGLPFQAAVPVQAIDFGLEALGPEEIPQLRRLVADGVAAMEGRDELVDPHRPGHPVDVSEQDAADVLPAERFPGPRLAGDDPRPGAPVVAQDPVDQGGRPAGSPFRRSTTPPPFMVSSTAPAA